VLKRHNKIKCTVTFGRARAVRGKLAIVLGQGSHVVALGHASLSGGRATVTMRELRRLRGRAATVTLVLSQPHQPAITMRLAYRLR
jgi:hypothetical protein